MKFSVLKIKRTIKEGFKALYHFGWGVAFAKVDCIWKDESLNSVQKKNAVILDYLKREYKDLLEQYSAVGEAQKSVKECSKAPIWVFWFQGKEQMSDLIQVCQKSREEASGKHPIILLDKDNIREYVSFPDTVWERFDKGNLRIQHLADMIRVQLIRKYGGLWLDASVFCHRKIPEEVFEYPVYSLKGEYMPEFVSGNRWTTFLIGGRRGNILCSFLDDFFTCWQKRRKPFIDYFMFDCAITLAYENIPAVQEEIDHLPNTEGDCYWLKDNLSKDVDEKLLREFMEEPSVFYKVAWAKDWEAEHDNTLYCYLLEKTRKDELEV